MQNWLVRTHNTRFINCFGMIFEAKSFFFQTQAVFHPMVFVMRKSAIFITIVFFQSFNCLIVLSRSSYPKLGTLTRKLLINSCNNYYHRGNLSITFAIQSAKMSALTISVNCSGQVSGRVKLLATPRINFELC